MAEGERKFEVKLTEEDKKKIQVNEYIIGKVLGVNNININNCESPEDFISLLAIIVDSEKKKDIDSHTDDPNKDKMDDADSKKKCKDIDSLIGKSKKYLKIPDDLQKKLKTVIDVLKYLKGYGFTEFDLNNFLDSIYFKLGGYISGKIVYSLDEEIDTLFNKKNINNGLFEEKELIKEKIKDLLSSIRNNNYEENKQSNVKDKLNVVRYNLKGIFSD